MFKTIIKKILGQKPEPVAEPKTQAVKAKRPLREDEILARKLAKMSEYERQMYYYEQSVKADYRSPLQIAMELTEERQKNYVARFEFSPTKQNFINVRSYCAYIEHTNEETALEKAKNRVMAIQQKRTYLWTYIRNTLEEKAGHRCIKCRASGKDQGFKTHTEAHEVWKYEHRLLKKDTKLINGDKTYILKAGKKVHVQTLKDIESLCGVCHQIKHFNRWFDNEAIQDILKQIYLVQNNVDEAIFQQDLSYAYDKQKLIDRTYLLDISALFDIAERAGFDKEAIEQLKEYQADVLFNPHSEEFKQFLNREFISKGEKDEG